jgi:hypothetical protein
VEVRDFGLPEFRAVDVVLTAFVYTGIGDMVQYFLI